MSMYVQIPATALGVGIGSSRNKRSGSLSRYRWRFHVPQPAPCFNRWLSGLCCRRDRLRHRPLCCPVSDVGDCGGGGKRRSGNSSNGVFGWGSTPDWRKPSPVTRRRLAGTGRLILGGLARGALWSEYLCRNGLARVKVLWGPAFLSDGYWFRLLGGDRWGWHRLHLVTDPWFWRLRTA